MLLGYIVVGTLCYTVMVSQRKSVNADDDSHSRVYSVDFTG